MPEPRTILLRDADPDHVVVGTRRGGYFATSDAGKTWSWLCEAGVGYDDEEVYPGALLPSGKLVLSTGFGGLAISNDGCDFAPWLPSDQPFVADVRARRDARDQVVALEGRVSGEGFVNQLWQSVDDAETWQPLGASFATDAQAVSFDVSNAGELYVAVSGPAGADLLRSDDAGESWLRSPIAAEPGVSARIIGAHESAESSSLYVIVDYAQADGVPTPGDRVLLSLDRGQSFVPLLEGVGDLPVWSLSPDGEHLAVGGHLDGLHVLTDGALTKSSSSAVHALAWDDAGRLFAAGHEAIDGFAVGVSEDNGETFSAFFALCQVNGPMECADSTTVGASCFSSGETGWDVRKEVASNDVCTTDGAGGAATLSPEPEQAPTADASDDDYRQAGTDTVSESSASCAASPSSQRGRASGFSALVLLLGVLVRGWRRAGGL